MITLRRARDRGHFDYGWLDTRHTFSFGRYVDPRFTGFRGLRVLNEDRVAPGRGFGEHPHADMEIISYVVSGSLAHRDSTGHQAVLTPGSVQHMSAGGGIEHSEFNPDPQQAVHFYQVWLHPRTRGVTPRFQAAPIPPADPAVGLSLVAAPHDAREPAAIFIHADARLWAGPLERGQVAAVPLATPPTHTPTSRAAWVQVVRGHVRVMEVELTAGDGAAIEGEEAVRIEALTDAEVLVFDLA